VNLPLIHQRVRLYVRLEPSNVRRIERATALLIAGAMVLTFAAHSIPWIPSPIRWQITLAAENNAAAWVASMLLFGVGLVALICAGVERLVAASGSGTGTDPRSIVVAWSVVAAGFFLLSLDEMGSLHERLADNVVVRLVLPEIGFVEGWAAVFTAPLVLLAVVVLWASWRHFQAVSGMLPLVSIGVLLFLTAPVHEHFEVAAGAANLHANAWGRPAWQIAAEEGTELLATLCFLAAGLRYAEHRSRGIRRLDGKVGVEIGWRIPTAALAVFTLALVAVHLAGPEVAWAAEGRGVPSNWFPSAAAFVGCLLALHLAAAERYRIGSPPGSLLALQALAGVNLVLSLGYAANSPVYHLLDNRPALQSGWMFAIGAGILAIGMYSARISNSGFASAGLLLWCGSFVVRPVLDLGSWAVVGFFAQFAVLSALCAILAERTRQMPVVVDLGPRVAPKSTPPRRKTA
jgi:hypothetical protein